MSLIREIVAGTAILALFPGIITADVATIVSSRDPETQRNKRLTMQRIFMTWDMLRSTATALGALTVLASNHTGVTDVLNQVFDGKIEAFHPFLVPALALAAITYMASALKLQTGDNE